jgi:hypothetical protein
MKLKRVTVPGLNGKVGSSSEMITIIITRAYPQSRKTHFAKEEKRLRYELLRQKLIEKIS